MNRVTLNDAQTRLPELIANLQPGEAVQITVGEKTIARLVAESERVRQPRKPGGALGTLMIIADDNEHLKDFEDYMP